MKQQFDVSVIISTYNRCELLPDALESVLAQRTGDVRYEVILVDNNSTDRTRQVVESLIERGHTNLRYVFEGKQGLSHGRNAGIANTSAPIITFTDDDVRVSTDWVANIVRVFDAHPEVDCVGGKVLPRWKSQPPAWLTRDHWSPLALVDYGDTSFYVNAENPICLVGANLSFRREVFEQVGLFASEFQRVKDGIGSTADHEMHLRLWSTGRQGFYMPDIVVTAEVQAERLTKAYHRRWHTGHGKYCSLMRLNEITGSGGRQTFDVTLFGAPACLYRELISEGRRWLAAAVRRRESLSFQHENNLRYFTSYIHKRYEQNAAEQKRSHLAELKTFITSMLRKKIRSESLTQIP